MGLKCEAVKEQKIKTAPLQKCIADAAFRQGVVHFAKGCLLWRGIWFAREHWARADGGVLKGQSVLHHVYWLHRAVVLDSVFG